MTQRAALTDAIRQWVADSPAGAIQAAQLIRQRPWSTVYRLTCEREILFFKQCGPHGKHESALLQWLLGQAPDLIPPTIKLDPGRGWILQRDAGLPLRGHFDLETQCQLLEQFLPRYGTLQLASVEQLNELHALDLPDRSLPTLPEGLARLKNDPRFTKYVPANVSAPAVDFIRQPVSPYAITLAHGDFHTNNMVHQNGQTALIDWGDACLTHPFTCLLATFNTLFDDPLAFRTHPLARRLRDCYLGRLPTNTGVETDIRRHHSPWRPYPLPHPRRRPRPGRRGPHQPMGAIHDEVVGALAWQVGGVRCALAHSPLQYPYDPAPRSRLAGLLEHP